MAEYPRHDPPRHIVAVMGVVRDAAGRVLLVRTARRGWEPPGGQVERGEDLLGALRREILEESGCEVTVGRLVAIYSNVVAPEKVMLTFLCAHVSGEPRPDPSPAEEITAAGWFTPEEALALVTAPTQAAKLRDALVYQAGDAVVYRVYRTRPYEALGEYRV